MPRQLTFALKGKEYITTPVKVDRRKLYGWTAIEALDDEGRPCELVTTDQTGTLIIPRGGTAQGILDPDGRWVERAHLVTVQSDGSEATLIPSSYNVTNELAEKTSEQDFLDHSITDFYQLTDVPPAFIRAVGKAIYTFRYTYLDSYETSPAFVMIADKTPYMLVGYRNRFDMLCLGDCGDAQEPDDDYIDIADDDLDFSMLY